MVMLLVFLVLFLKFVCCWFGNVGQCLFCSDVLVQVDVMFFQVISDDGLVQLCYYLLLWDIEIELDNGEVVLVSIYIQCILLVLVLLLVVNMLIYDLFLWCSLVCYLCVRGFEFYLVDWG